MKPRNKIAITFIFALLVCLMFQTLPILGLSNLQAQDPLPMPTYDWDHVKGKLFPDFSDYDGYYDGHFFRTAICKINLVVDEAEINNLLVETGWEGWKAFTAPYGLDPYGGEAVVEIQWLYRLFNQWRNDNLTHETISGLTLGALARKEGDDGGVAFFVFADVRSPGSSVDQFNQIVGGGAEVSREGRLKIEFESESDPDREATLKFKARVKEPVSGLDVKVDATLPEGQIPVRVVKNPAGLQILFLDLSDSQKIEEGCPFIWWLQQDKYDFDETTQPFELKVKIPEGELKLPGNRGLSVIRVQECLSLRRNIDVYSQFIDPDCPLGLE